MISLREKEVFKMKWIAVVLVALGALALILAVVERLFGFYTYGVSPDGFLRFANTCILLGISLGILEWRLLKKQ